MCEAVKDFPVFETTSITKTGFSLSDGDTPPPAIKPVPDYVNKYLGILGPANALGERFTPFEGLVGARDFPQGKIMAAEFWNGHLFVGGQFDKVTGLANTRSIARLDAGSKTWLPVFVDRPLSSMMDDSSIYSMLVLPGEDALYIAGKFENAFGAIGARNIAILQKGSDPSKIDVRKFDPALPSSCQWVSDLKKGEKIVSNVTYPIWYAVCNTADLSYGTTNVFKNKSSIFKLDMSASPLNWTMLGDEFTMSQEEPKPSSVVISFDARGETVVAALRTYGGYPGESVIRSKIQMYSGSGWIDVVAEDGVRFAIALRPDKSAVLFAGRVDSDNHGVIEAAPLARSTGVYIPGANIFLKTGLVGPINVMKPYFEKNLFAVASDQDIAIFKADITTQPPTFTVINPQSGGKAVKGYKTILVPNRLDDAGNSFFVAGNFPASESPGCSAIEVLIPRLAINLNDFPGGSPQLTVNQKLVNISGDFKKTVEASQESVKVLAMQVSQLPDVLSAEGRTISLQLPPGCMFSFDGKQFNTWGLDFNYFEKSLVAEATTSRLCTARTPFDPTLLQRSLTINCKNPTVGTGVTNQPTTEIQVDPLQYGEEYFGQVRGVVYSRMESLRIVNNDIGHTVEVFKSNDCTGGLVSSKSEFGVYSTLPVDIEGTIPVDIKLQRATGKISNPDWFASRNKVDRIVSSCGVMDWEFDRIRDLPSGKTCFTAGVISPRLRVIGDELLICGDQSTGDHDVKERPSDCSTYIKSFKRAPKR